VPPAPAAAVNDWPIGVVIGGLVLTGLLSIISGLAGVVLFLMLGGASVWGRWNGEWGGIGGFLQVMSVFMVVVGPLWGSCHLAGAVGIYRRRRWARYLVLGLCSFSLLRSAYMLFLAPSSMLLSGPGLALDIFSVVVLLRKPYASQFHTRSADSQPAAPVVPASAEPQPDTPLEADSAKQ
jgi:hypothetical protein